MREINVLKILGRNVFELRFKKNMTIQELAEKSKIEVTTLRKFEKGEYSGLTLLQYPDIADALGTTMSKLTKGLEFVDD